MLSEEFRKKLMEKLKKNPEELIEELKKEPKILGILLSSDKKAEEERKEKVKYVNMNMQMERQLREQAKKLNTTQGLLIGAGLLWLLSQLDK